MSALDAAIKAQFPWLAPDTRGVDPEILFLGFFRSLFGQALPIQEEDVGLYREQAVGAYQAHVIPAMDLEPSDVPLLSKDELIASYTPERIREFKQAQMDVIHCPLDISISLDSRHAVYAALIKLDEGVFLMILNRGSLAQALPLAMYPVHNPDSITAEWVKRLIEPELPAKAFQYPSHSSGKLFRGLALGEPIDLHEEKRLQARPNCLYISINYLFLMARLKSVMPQHKKRSLRDFKRWFSGAEQEYKSIRRLSLAPLLKQHYFLLRAMFENDAPIPRIAVVLRTLEGACEWMKRPNKSAQPYRKETLVWVYAMISLLRIHLETPVSEWLESNDCPMLKRLSLLPADSWFESHVLFNKSGFDDEPAGADSPSSPASVDRDDLVSSNEDVDDLPEQAIPADEGSLLKLTGDVASAFGDAIYENATAEILPALELLALWDEPKKAHFIRVVLRDVRSTMKEEEYWHIEESIEAFLLWIEAQGLVNSCLRNLMDLAHQAIKFQRVDVLHSLLPVLFRSADMFIGPSFDLVNLWHFVAESGDVDVATLIERYFPLGSYSSGDLLNKFNESPLHLAAENRRSLMFTYLCENGLEDIACNDWGESAFFLAVTSKDLSMILAAIKHFGPESNGKTIHGEGLQEIVAALRSISDPGDIIEITINEALISAIRSKSKFVKPLMTLYSEFNQVTPELAARWIFPTHLLSSDVDLAESALCCAGFFNLNQLGQAV